MSFIKQSDVAIQPFDVHTTTLMQLLGKFDPTGARNASAFVKLHSDRDGSTVAWRFTQTAAGVRIDSHGDRYGLHERLLAQFPLADGAATFRPAHPLLQRLAKAACASRIIRVPWVFDVAAGAVLQQRVRWQVGYGDFRKVALRWGTRTAAGTAFPNAERLARVSVAQLEALGLDPQRARTLHNLARAEAYHHFLRPDADLKTVEARLLSLPGIGPWTTGLVLGYAYGDTDAVPLGDLHLPAIICSALAGEADGSDERMLDLLEPYRGQRFRIIRVLTWATRRAPHVLRIAKQLAAAR